METKYLREFVMMARTARPGFYPVVIHAPCNKAVITGTNVMDKVMEAMERHECSNASTSA